MPTAWRDDLWELIRTTPHLDWLLLTKRPQNIATMLPDDWGGGWPHVWLGVTVENQAEADRRIPVVLRIPAIVRFLSCEPLLGPLDLWKACAGGQGIHWVIAGGENASHYRPADLAWFRGVRDQCLAAGVSFYFKQWAGTSQKAIKKLGRELDDQVWDQYPESST